MARADIPGKEVLMLTVEYPPGGADPVHRHDAHGFVYVLEGSIVMQVKGGAEVTLTPGQTFYEGLHDVHTIGRNASATQPASRRRAYIQGVSTRSVDELLSVVEDFYPSRLRRMHERAQGL
ncbi:MAG TPA: cupin domain-containing protein [Gammaproteobacteria bacterium]